MTINELLRRFIQEGADVSKIIEVDYLGRTYEWIGTFKVPSEVSSLIESPISGLRIEFQYYDPEFPQRGWETMDRKVHMFGIIRRVVGVEVAKSIRPHGYRIRLTSKLINPPGVL